MNAAELQPSIHAHPDRYHGISLLHGQFVPYKFIAVGRIVFAIPTDVIQEPAEAGAFEASALSARKKLTSPDASISL